VLVWGVGFGEAGGAQSCSEGLTLGWVFLAEALRYCLGPVVAQSRLAWSVLPLRLVDAGPPPPAFKLLRNSQPARQNTPSLVAGHS
jgi:hypothetical protein